MAIICRVDDVAWNSDKQQDAGLAYFSRWRDAIGLAGCPVYYAAIPAMMGPAELEWCRNNLRGGERLAVHGWDHARKATVTRDQMSDALRRFRMAGETSEYIPPFNAYSPATIRDWTLAVGGPSYFFGGFHGEHHNYGHYPVAVEPTTIHLPAFRPLYDHTEPLLEALPKYADIDGLPLVVTLHCTWAHQRMDLLPRLGELLRPHLVSLDAVPEWMAKTQLNLRRLQSAQYQSQKWVLERVGGNGSEGVDGIGERVMDFGARDGELAAQMALRGCRVTGFDRDSRILEQDKLASRFGVRLNWTHAASIDAMDHPIPVPTDFDCVTATWAIQHNLPGETEIPKVAAALSRRIKPGGRLLIVSSFTPGESFDQLERKDPQRVLSWADHERLIIQPAGCKLHGKPHYFRYDHGTTNGGPCPAGEACAVAYELRKPTA